MTEAEWWASARDLSADLPPCNDPLACSKVDFASSLRTAMQSQWELDDPSELKHPWEEGVFKDIFGRGNEPIQWCLKRTMPALHHLEKATEGLPAPSGKRLKRERFDASFELVVKHRAAVDWKSQRSEQLDIGLRLWLKVTSSWEACLLRSQLDEMDQSGQITLLGYILRGKAPSTVLKRARSLVPVMDFLRENETFFPCDEELLYSFLKKLESSGAPKSRLCSLMEYLNFVEHVMGVSEASLLTSSRRCKGVCVFEIFKEAKQAPALTVQQLIVLRETVESHPDLWTRCFAGAALLCCYARCRWSDVQHAESIEWDVDDSGTLVFIELRIGVHKTCRLQSKRHKFLKAVAPALGVKGNFGEPWKLCRKMLGIADPPVLPFFPAPDSDGVPTVRGLGSDEATAWLRMILKESPGGSDVTSKSCKATMISWAAKRGVEPLSLQRLGYHASGGLDIVYSRDAQAPLILIVEKLLKEVREGLFKPDVTRGGRLVSEAPQPLVQSIAPLLEPTAHFQNAPDCQADAPQEACKSEAGQDPPAVIEVDEISDAGSPCGDSSSSSEEEEDDQPLSMINRKEAVPDGFDLWRHLDSKIVHLVPQRNFKNLLACGRRVGAKHQKLAVRSLSADDVQCKFCFRR